VGTYCAYVLFFRVVELALKVSIRYFGQANKLHRRRANRKFPMFLQGKAEKVLGRILLVSKTEAPVLVSRPRPQDPRPASETSNVRNLRLDLDRSSISERIDVRRAVEVAISLAGSGLSCSINHEFAINIAGETAIPIVIRANRDKCRRDISREP